MDDQVLKQVRVFNRFLTARLSVFNRYALGTTYSLVEGRIIGEIGRNEGCTANKIAEDLNMDKSYLSRILSRLEPQGLIKRVVSDTDNRMKHLTLTLEGRALFLELERLSDQQAADMVAGLDDEQIEGLLKSMHYIQATLEKKENL
jgi:DNA-binding MarR family transcriptional regulator